MYYLTNNWLIAEGKMVFHSNRLQSYTIFFNYTNIFKKNMKILLEKGF